MNDNTNFENFYNNDENKETMMQEPAPAVQNWTPEVQPKPKKAKKHIGLAVGVIAASLVLGTAAGFGGSALYDLVSQEATAKTAELPPEGFNRGSEKGQLPDGEAPNGQLPDGEAPDGQMPFGQKPEEEAPAEDSEIGNGLFPFNEKSDEKKSDSDKGDKKGDASLTLSTKSNGTSLSTEEIAAVAKDAVVEITTEYVKTGNYMQQYVSSGAGSGVIISQDGYIITNNHVIEDATQITVTTTDGTSYEAQLVGRDDQLDVALLKIDASGLNVASFGDSDNVDLGEKVVAIGNPLGQLGGTVTEGIISSLNREITIDNKAMTLMQTDAAINPGNSGGGLFNDEGQLIGLVVAKSTGEDVEGIGFAIPINNVQAILNDLLNYGYTKGKAYVGVSLLDISSDQMAMMYNVSETGTYVYSVEDGSAADEAGLQSGDRIISINGTEITSVDQVKDMITKAGVGAKLTFTVARRGQQGDIEVTVGEYVPAAMPSQEQGFGFGH